VQSAEPGKTGQQHHAEVVQHITEAHQILGKLRQELDKHPAVEEAIQKLEMALALLSVKTGGFL